MDEERGERSTGTNRDGWLVREAEFLGLYRDQAQGVLAFFTQRTGQGQVALDLTAETFAQAFAGRARFRGTSNDEARAWLFAIAANLLASYLRRGYAERRMVQRLRVEVPAVGDETDRIMQLDAVRQLRPVIEQQLERLSSEQREAVELRVVDEMGFAAIAARLGISEPAARMRVSRGLNTLIQGLGPTSAWSEDLR